MRVRELVRRRKRGDGRVSARLLLNICKPPGGRLYREEEEEKERKQGRHRICVVHC